MKTINRVLFTAIVGIWILLSDPIARSQPVSDAKIPVPTKRQEQDPEPPDSKRTGVGVSGGAPGVKQDPPLPEDKETGVGTTPSATDPEPPDSKPTGVGTTPSVRGNFCLIAPSTLGQTSTIWNDLPLFIWDGNVSNIELRDHNSDTALWTAQPDATASTFQYDGEPLEPGQTYDVVMTTTGELIFTFTVMDAQTRAGIAADLQALEERAIEQGADEGSIAFARAQYFANRGLRWDALQEVFSVIEPGEDAISIAALLTCDLQNE
ncbi:MAG: hypothetical protein WBB29_11360 [Geitlerinemataceae cyanobacterium]